MNASQPTQAGVRADKSQRKQPHYGTDGWPAEEATPLTTQPPAHTATPAAKALWVATAFFGCFAIAQIIGGHVANSLSLQTDGATMLVDCSTYLLNIAAEYKQRENRMWRTTAVCWSILALLGVGIYSTVDATRRLRDANSTWHINKNVDPNYLLGFTLGNLLVDVVVIVDILLRNRGGCARLLGLADGPVEDEISSITLLEPSVVLQPSHHKEDSHQASETGQVGQKQDGTGLNLNSAIAHILMDLVRTCTSIVATIVLYNDPEQKREGVDAVGALIFSGVAFIVVACITHAFVQDLVKAKGPESQSH